MIRGFTRSTSTPPGPGYKCARDAESTRTSSQRENAEAKSQRAALIRPHSRDWLSDLAVLLQSNTLPGGKKRNQITNDRTMAKPPKHWKRGRGRLGVLAPL